MAKPQWTDEQVLKQLNSGELWPDLVISYAFPLDAKYLYAGKDEATGFSPLTAEQQSLAKLALATWSELIRPTFVQTDPEDSDIAFGNSYTSGGYAHAFYPEIGSVWFSNASDLQPPVFGEYGFATYIHEIGHALGLDHMGDYNGDDDDGPSSFQDSTMLSIMSYYGPGMQRGKGDVAWGDWMGSDGKFYSSQTPMLNDIMAIQAMYGASTTTRADNTVYGFGATVTGGTASIYDFTLNKNPILTIYDSGGIDTLNLSGWSTDSDVDLRDGEFSSANGMTNNLAIARGVVIENAITGAGNDTLHGNSANNFLDGGAGMDVAFFTGVLPNYQLNYNLTSREYTVHDGSGADGTDTLLNIEYAVFENFGGELNDLTPGVHRFYNTQKGSHFFTSNNDEATAVAQMDGFQYEGINFARNVMNEANSVIVHRFYNDTAGTHFYTADRAEAAFLRETEMGLRYEGAAYNAYRQKTDATTELYRFYNTETGSHFYTANVQEMEHVKIDLAGSFNYEGVAYYVQAA